MVQEKLKKNLSEENADGEQVRDPSPWDGQTHMTHRQYQLQQYIYVYYNGRYTS